MSLKNKNSLNTALIEELEKHESYDSTYNEDSLKHSLYNSNSNKVLGEPNIALILLDMLEKRIPPLQNLTNGVHSVRKNEVTAKLEFILEELAHFRYSKRCNTLDQIELMLGICTSGELLRMLIAYFTHSTDLIFRPSRRLCQLAVLCDNVPSLCQKSSDPKVLKELEICLKQNGRHRSMLFSLIMLKLQRWILNHVAYRDTKPFKKSEHLLLEGSFFFARIFAKSMINIPYDIRASMYLKRSLHMRDGVTNEVGALLSESIKSPDRMGSLTHDNDSLHSATFYFHRKNPIKKVVTKYHPQNNRSPTISEIDKRSESMISCNTIKCSQAGDYFYKDMTLFAKTQDSPQSSSKKQSEQEHARRHLSKLQTQMPISIEPDVRQSIFMLMIHAVGSEFWHNYLLQCPLQRIYCN